MGFARVYLVVKRQTIFILLAFLCLTHSVWGQDRKVQNRPYIDLRRFHFGIQVGMHMQDIELMNVGPIMMVDENGVATESFISCDENRWDPGFNVGVVGELRLNEFFQFRIAPTIYFGSRHIIFRNHTQSTENNVVEEHQDLKSAYIMATFDLIFAAPRVNNHRLYVMAGVSPALNLISKASDYLRLKRGQVFLELGLGFDRYLPYFKCRPELKFMYGLGNALNTNHVDELRDSNMKAYTQSVSGAHTKMITLTIYFE